MSQMSNETRVGRLHKGKKSKKIFFTVLGTIGLFLYHIGFFINAAIKAHQYIMTLLA